MFQRLCSHKSACRRLQTIQSHAHAHKYTTHVYMKAYILVHVIWREAIHEQKKSLAEAILRMWL